MSYADSVSRSAHRVVLAQVLTTGVMAMAFGVLGGLSPALGAGYGGLMTVLLTVWLAWRTRRADSLAAIYSGALARYALAAAAIGFGIVLLKLPALPLLCAFAVTQFGYLILLRRPSRARQDEKKRVD